MKLAWLVWTYDEEEAQEAPDIVFYNPEDQEWMYSKIVPIVYTEILPYE